MIVANDHSARGTHAASNSGLDAAPPTSGSHKQATTRGQPHTCNGLQAVTHSDVHHLLPIRPTDTQQASDALQDPRGHMRVSVAQCRTPRFEPDGYYLINRDRLIAAISTNGG